MDDIFEQAVVCFEGVVLDLAVGTDAFVGEADEDAGVEIGEFTQAVCEDGVVEGGVFEDLVVGFEDNGGACGSSCVFGDLAHIVEWFGDNTAFEDDRFDFAITPDLDFE